MPTPVSGPYSVTRRAGELVFVSGQLGRNKEGTYADGVVAQTAAALQNLDEAVAAAGGTLDDVVRCQVFLSDIGDWASMTEEYLRWFSPPLPTRTAVGAGLPDGALVEIDAVAYVPQPASA